MSTAMKTLAGEINERRQKLAKLFADTRQPDGRFNLDAAQRDDVKSLNAELDAKSQEYEGLRADDEMARKNAEALKSLSEPIDHLPFPGQVNEGPPLRVSTIGELFAASEAFKAFEPGKMTSRMVLKLDDRQTFDHLKTVMTLSAGYAPANNRTNIVIPSAQRRPMVSDLIPQDPTDLTQIRYLRETTFTNNAATVAENAVKPESALALTEVQSNVQVIATTLPVTNQQLADVPGIRSYIDNRLTLQVLLVEENQILTGDGTSSNLTGFLNTSGVLTGAAANQGDVPAAIFRQITAVRSTTGFADPSGVIMHPLDWMDVRLTTTSTGEFLWGPPSEEGTARIWGLPVIPTPAMTQNTALLGDFRTYSHISRRMGLVIEVGYVNDDFVRNRATLRAEERLSLEIYRPAAFSTVTGV
jgi:HK97 family phage major capsid protein